VTTTTWAAFGGVVWANALVVMVMVCFVPILLMVVVLCCLHSVVLIPTNQTQYECIKGPAGRLKVLFERLPVNVTPFDRGCWFNVREYFCLNGRINFRLPQHKSTTSSV
jgi:hypothetical protein